MNDLLQRMIYLEARVQNLEQLVVRLQDQLQDKSKEIRNNVQEHANSSHVLNNFQKPGIQSPQIPMWQGCNGGFGSVGSVLMRLRQESEVDSMIRQRTPQRDNKPEEERVREHLEALTVSSTPGAIKENEDTLVQNENESKKQKVHSPATASLLQQQRDLHQTGHTLTTPKKENLPAEAPSQQQIDNSHTVPRAQCSKVLVDVSPMKENHNLNGALAHPRKHPAHLNATVASSCAFVKVTGAMGSHQGGGISTSNHHLATLQLDIDANEGTIWLSSSLRKSLVKEPSAQVENLDFLEMGVAFATAQVVPDSLEYGRVVDTLVLPLTVLDQLDDPNEVPPNLCYISWKYHGCGADGFERFENTHTKFDQNDRIMKLYRQILGHRQKIQVWFIARGQNVDEVVACFRARCCREMRRAWQPCSGHLGYHAAYCPDMGKKRRRKGVSKFLEQSAPPRCQP